MNSENVITASLRRVLVSLANTPTNPVALAATLDISTTTVRKYLRDGQSKELIHLWEETYYLTDKGQKAITDADVTNIKQTSAFLRAKPSNNRTASYEVYVPTKYDHNVMRPGSMDAFSLPSMTPAGRVYP